MRSGGSGAVPTRPDPPEPPPPRLIGPPVVLIVFALVALVVLPLAVQREVDEIHQHETEVLQPARDAVNRVQVALSQEMGAVRDVLIPGGETLLDPDRARAEVDRSLVELDTLAQRLDPDVAAALEALSARVSRWYELLEANRRSRSGLRPIDESLTYEPVYREALDAAERLRDLLIQRAEADQREIERLDRAGAVVTAALGVVALGAAIVALWLGKQRIVAWEARRDRREVERLLESRGRLIRGLTHDLKNPLGAARGHLQLLREGVLSDDAGREEALSRMDRALGRAVDLVDDLLHLSRAEAGELSVAVEPVDLGPVLRRTAEEYQGEAEREEVTLRIDVPGELPVVKTDPARVSDVVRNLLSNGIKYTPAGGEVCLSVAASRQAAGEDDEGVGRSESSLAVEVRDTGPGIAPEDVERIFLEFSRLGPGDAEGVGLGLAISLEVARLLGGDLTVESEPGEGAAFTLLLPPEPPPEARPSSVGGRDARARWKRRPDRRRVR